MVPVVMMVMMALSDHDRCGAGIRERANTEDGGQQESKCVFHCNNSIGRRLGTGCMVARFSSHFISRFALPKYAYSADSCPQASFHRFGGSRYGYKLRHLAGAI